MKKVLLVLVLLLSIVLIGCTNDTQTTLAPNTVNDYGEDINAVENDLDALETELNEQLEVINAKIAELQARLDDLVVVEGLNGQKEYYENAIKTLSDQAQLLNTQIGATPYYDTDSSPDYTRDENGNYINVYRLGALLKNKYFSDLPYFDNGSTADGELLEGYMLDKLYIGMRLDNIDEAISEEEIMARVILMVKEIRNYTAYSIGCTYFEINLFVATGMGSRTYNLKIPLTVMLNEYFSVEIGAILSGDYEMYLNVIGIERTYKDSTVISYYDNFVLNGTYDGYVLNYTE